MRTSRFIEELTMKLIYRAQTFDYNPRPRPIQLNYSNPRWVVERGHTQITLEN